VIGPVLGCAHEPPPLERVPVAAPGDRAALIEQPRPKPLPDNARLYDRDRDYAPEPPFYDPPLVTQRTPEQARFEQAYRAVGKPRITVFVNRTLEGTLVPVNPHEPAVGVERTRGATGGVTVERSDYNRRTDRTEKFQTAPGAPGEYRETTKVYLKPGQYDAANAKSIDYQAMETVLTDFLACQGTVEIMSPTTARQRLSDDQVKALQSGRPQVLREVAQQLETDVLIQVSAHPTRQTEYGLEVRLVAEALNVKGGQQVGRAIVDLEPPLDKPTLNKYTRYVARKLMMDMTQNWGSEPPAPREGDRPPAKPAPEPPADPK
jgi:hypothetical protein